MSRRGRPARGSDTNKIVMKYEWAVEPPYVGSFTSQYEFLATFPTANWHPEVRSKYIHHVLVWTENEMDQYIDHPKVYVISMDEVDTLYEKIYRVYMLERPGMEGDFAVHRQLIWMCLCRLTYMKQEYTNDPTIVQFGSHRDKVAYLQGLEVIPVDFDFEQCDLFNLWQAMMLLKDKLNYIDYSHDIEEYSRILYLLTAKFQTEFEPENSALYNFKIFKELLKNQPDDKTGMKVNELFCKETEKYFYHLWIKFDKYHKFIHSPLKFLFPATDHDKFHQWISSWTDPGQTFAEEVARKLKEVFWESHLQITELETFVELGQATRVIPQNIIMNTRDYFYEQITDWINLSDCLTKIMTDHMNERTKKNNMMVDYNYENLCRTVITMYIVNYFSEFAYTFFIDEYQYTTYDVERDFNKPKDIPIIIRTFNRLGVYYKKKLFYTKTIEDTFLLWINMLGKLNNQKTDEARKFGAQVRTFYRLFFDDLSIISDGGQEQVQFELPAHYQKSRKRREIEK